MPAENISSRRRTAGVLLPLHSFLLWKLPHICIYAICIYTNFFNKCYNFKNKLLLLCDCKKKLLLQRDFYFGSISKLYLFCVCLYLLDKICFFVYLYSRYFLSLSVFTVMFEGSVSAEYKEPSATNEIQMILICDLFCT